MGEQGSAKTTMINSHIKTYSAETHMVMQSTFSSTTTPQLFQKSIESTVDKRMGTTYVNGFYVFKFIQLFVYYFYHYMFAYTLGSTCWQKINDFY